MAITGKRHWNSTKGFTLLEVLMAATILMIFGLGVMGFLNTSVRNTRRTEESTIVLAKSQELLVKINDIRFGSDSDPVPSLLQLEEFFDDDDDLGSISFYQLVLAAAPPAHLTFTVAGVKGAGRLIVDNDLNGDADRNDFREGRNDLYRIEVRFHNATLLRTLRAAPAEVKAVTGGASAGFGAAGASKTGGRGDMRWRP